MFRKDKRNAWFRCVETFDCSAPNESVHFKFDRFHVEETYDYLVIGYPNQFDHYYDYNFGSVGHGIEKPTSRTGLMLHGQQQTGIWVNAQSIPTFNIYFYRNLLKYLYKMNIKKYLKSIEK